MLAGMLKRGRRWAAYPVLLLLGPLRVLKDVAGFIWTFPANYRAWRLWRDALDRQIIEHYERKGIPYSLTRTGRVRPRWPIC